MGISSTFIPTPTVPFSASFRAFSRLRRARTSSLDEAGCILSAISCLVGGSASICTVFLGTVTVLLLGDDLGMGAMSRNARFGGGRGGDGGFAFLTGRPTVLAPPTSDTAGAFTGGSGAREGAREGASRSSSSEDSDVESSTSMAAGILRPFAFPGVGVGLLGLFDLCSFFSGFEYPAAALVLAVTPCRPVKPVNALLGLVVINWCKCVPCHGASCPSFASNSLSSLSSSSFLRFGITLSTPLFVLASCASASFFFFVSARIVVMLSTGLEILEIVEAFRFLASFFRRTYSAWCKCAVNVRATERNSSSTIM